MEVNAAEDVEREKSQREEGSQAQGGGGGGGCNRRRVDAAEETAEKVHKTPLKVHKQQPNKPRGVYRGHITRAHVVLTRFIHEQGSVSG